jgi:hypothetical protein
MYVNQTTNLPGGKMRDYPTKLSQTLRSARYKLLQVLFVHYGTTGNILIAIIESLLPVLKPWFIINRPDLRPRLLFGPPAS